MPMNSALIRFTAALALVFVAARAPSAAPESTGADAAFAAFWEARSPQEAAKLVQRIVESGIGFDEALQRFRQGRTYSANVPKGVVKLMRAARGTEFPYAVNVPESYDPARRYQLRFQLHGGVGRPGNQQRGDGSIGALAGAEQIYVLPTAWREAPWWDDAQLENLSLILDSVKRTYNVDENRVVMAGVSDGGSGAYYFAMRDTTPFASFLTLNGFVGVLGSVEPGDIYPNNLRNKPFFVVNGGRDPLYPVDIVQPYIEHLKENGVTLDFHPQPNGVHNTAWWPDVKDAFETFVRDHPRVPQPASLTWESDATPTDNRAAWLVIDRLSPPKPTDAKLDDLNQLSPQYTLFQNGGPSGRIDLTRAGNTVKAATRGVLQFTLLLSPDVFDFGQPVRVETNGRVAFEGRVEKSVATLAQWVARDNDRTMLYGAELHITVR